MTWNNYLFEKAGELFPNKLIELIESDIDTSSVLNLIPNFYKLLDINDDEKIQFIKAFKKGFDKNITSKQFIPTKAGSLEALSNILIDETGISVLLKEEFFNLIGITNLLIHTEVGEGVEKIKALITEYKQGVVYRIENLKADLKTAEFQEWLKIPKNNFKLIQHFSSKEDLRALLESEKIILSESKQLYKSSSLLKSVPIEVDFLGVEKINSLVLSLLNENKISLDLAVFEPAQFYKAIILAKHNVINLSLDNETTLLNFWRFIFDNWDLFESEPIIKDSLKYFEVLCKPNRENQFSKKVISLAYLSAEFNATNEIESVVKEISPNALFISEKYIDDCRDAEKWRKIFKLAKSITDLQKVIEVLIVVLATIEVSKHFQITKQIFKYWKENKALENKLTVNQIGLIKNNLKIKCLDEKLLKPTECFISDHYTTNNTINSLLQEIDLPNEISIEYSNTQISEWNVFFKEIGCIPLEEKQKVLDAKLTFIIASQDKLQEKHIKILKNIADLYNSKNTNGLIFNDVLSNIKLQTSNGEWHLPTNIHLSSSYKPKLDLQNDESIKSTLLFLSDKYIPTVIEKNFLTDIGINDGFFFKKIIPIIHIDKVQESKFVSQLESIERYRIRLLQIKNMTSTDPRGFSIRSYPDEKIRINTYVSNHLLINYPLLLTIPKYLESFINFVIKFKKIDILSIESEIKIWNNNVYRHPNYILWLIQTHNVLANQEDKFVLPTELFSFNLCNYISNKAELPKLDYTIHIAENGKSLEEVLGIQQKLSKDHCIDLLCRKEDAISFDEVNQLQIVETLSSCILTDAEKAKIYLLNKNCEWKTINELFISTDKQFQIEPTQHLHEIFYSIAHNFGIQELSEDNLVLKTYPLKPSVKDEIKTFFSSNTKFIAFKIDQSNYEKVEASILESINSFEFCEVTTIEKIFPEVNPIYKTEIDFHIVLDGNKIIYKGNWKTNEKTKDFLFTKILLEKLPRQWFENTINRWVESDIIKSLKDDFGDLVPFETDISGINVSNQQSKNESDEINNEVNEPELDNPFKDISQAEEDFIRSIIQGEFELNEQLDANTTAKIKTLLKIRNQYSLSEISDEGRFLKAATDEILVRSAQNGLLYLDLYHWGRLSEANVRLAVYTKNQIEIYKTQEELIQFTKPQNKFGILRMPTEYDTEYYNSLENITDKGKWHFVFIVNENTKAAQSYKEVMNLDDYNF